MLKTLELLKSKFIESYEILDFKMKKAVGGSDGIILLITSISKHFLIISIHQKS